jgi:TonB family protein
VHRGGRLRVPLALTLALSPAALVNPQSPAGGASPTTAAVASLMLKPLGPAELAVLENALGSASPATRGVAARVARLQAAGTLVPALRAAVAKETALGALHEEMVALAWLGGLAEQDALFAAAGRFEGSLDDTLALSLAMRGPPALDLAPRLKERDVKPSGWLSYFAWATRGGREGMSKAAEAARVLASPESWEALLDLSAKASQPLPDAEIVRSLASQDARIRELSYWYLMKAHELRGTTTPDMAAALARTVEALEANPVDARATLALELLQRATGRKPVDRTALIGQLDRNAAAKVPTDRSVLSRLEEPEKKALSAARGDPDWVNDRLKDGVAREFVESHPLRGRRIRSVSDLSPGVVADVLASTGCRLPSDPGWAMAEARFDAAGTLQSVGFHPLTGTIASCEPAARTLLLLSLLPTDRPPQPGENDAVLLPLSKEFAECAERIERPALKRASEDMSPATVKAPRKTRNVAPGYPPRARQERRSGVVIAEAIISPKGCVASVEILSSEHLDLAGEALRAVMQWRYTPTLLNGTPVPVIMTVTVNFKLSY